MSSPHVPVTDRKELPIAVLYGGRGCEREISQQSAAHVCERLREASLPCLPVGITRAGDWFLFRGDMAAIRDGSWCDRQDLLTPTYPVRLAGCAGLIADGVLQPLRAAIPVLHGDHGEDGEIQGALTAATIPFVGADVRTGALTSDKLYTKIMAEHLGIPIVPYLPLALPSDGRCDRIRRQAEAALGYPMILKPTRLGSSIGIAVIRCAEEFAPACRAALPYAPLMLERFLSPITELECAYLEGEGNGERPILTPPATVSLSHGFYSYREKYGGDSHANLSVKPPLPPSVVADVGRYAAALIDLLSIRGLARLDFFLTNNGSVLFNEINVFPGMTESSLYLRLLSAAGVEEGEVLRRLLALAERRDDATQREDPPTESENGGWEGGRP